MRIIIDTNGNKCIKIESADFNSGRGFSIQTNGNLPIIHHDFSVGNSLKDYNLWQRNMIISEVKSYVSKYGTPKQQMKVLGFITK